MMRELAGTKVAVSDNAQGTSESHDDATGCGSDQHDEADLQGLHQRCPNKSTADISLPGEPALLPSVPSALSHLPY